MKYCAKVIDGHIHLMKWFDASGVDFFTGLDRVQEESGIDALNLACLPNQPRGDVSLNIMAALYKLHNPTAFAHADIIYPSFPVRPPLPEGMDSLTQYNELMEVGFDGIKMICTKPQDHKLYDLPVTDEFYEPFFSALEKDRTHLLWHVVDPETFWDIKRIPPEHYARGWYYGDGSYASNKQIYSEVFGVLDRHPLLNITFAHFFFLSDHTDELERVFETYKNVCVDVTPGTEMYDSFSANRPCFRAFFTKYADRILFGTDTDFPSPENLHLQEGVYEALTTDKEDIKLYGHTYKGIGLPAEAADKILNGNFRRNVSDTPKPINKAALKKYIQKYQHLIVSDDIRSRILAIAETL